jgi:Zn-dependent metalloprotease
MGSGPRRTVLAAAAAAALAAAVAAGTPTAATASEASLPADLVPVRSVTSLTGTHHWYGQLFHGLPVIDSYYAVHRDSGTEAVTIADGRRAVPASLQVTPSISSAQASTTTTRTLDAQPVQRTSGPKGIEAAPATAGRATLSVLGGASPALVWAVVAESGRGITRTLVDARTGGILQTRVLSKNVDGKGQVFEPNPVVTLRDEGLKDNHDENQAALDPAYRAVTLKRLWGNGLLQGKYAKVISARGGLATSRTNTFVYSRSDHRFEQVNAYYGVDGSQAYLQQLGFTDANNQPQRIKTNTLMYDNSFYDPEYDVLVFGMGGVDDAEDLEVVWHEYGHAIQDAIVPDFGTTPQAGAIGEGFGDYWAVTMSIPTSGGFDLPCVADWDSVSYTSSAPHCLRRIDGDKTTDDIDGEVHDDGEIWSRALWDVMGALGRTKADTIVIESTYRFTPDTTFAAAARQTVATARALYGASAASAVKAAFVARKIL